MQQPAGCRTTRAVRIGKLVCRLAQRVGLKFEMDADSVRIVTINGT